LIRKLQGNLIASVALDQENSMVWALGTRAKHGFL